MAEDNKVYIPASSGGIISYYNDLKSRVSFDPKYVIIAIAVILILEFILHQSFPF